MEGKPNTHECIRENDFKELRGMYKDGHQDIMLIKEALGIKNLENGARDKQIDELKARAKEIGDKTEEEDKSIYNMVNDLRVILATKADAKELPSKLLIYLNTIILLLFVITVIIDNARNAIFFKILGL